MKYCDFNGCDNKINQGKYCEEHVRSKRQRKKKDIYHHENKPFYRTKEWEAMRQFIYEKKKVAVNVVAGSFMVDRHMSITSYLSSKTSFLSLNQIT